MVRQSHSSDKNEHSLHTKKLETQACAVYMSELIPGRVSSRVEFHLGVWSFVYLCLHDPGVKFVHAGLQHRDEISSRDKKSM